MLANALQLWMLLGLTFLFSILGAFHGAAFDTSYAMLVPEAQLPRANGMMQTIWSLSCILSPAIAAGLIALPAWAARGLAGRIGRLAPLVCERSPLATGDLMRLPSCSRLLPCCSFISIAGAHRFAPARWEGQEEPVGRYRRGRKIHLAAPADLWLLGTFTVANFVSSPGARFTPADVEFILAPDWMSHGSTFEATLALPYGFLPLSAGSRAGCLSVRGAASRSGASMVCWSDDHRSGWRRSRLVSRLQSSSPAAALSSSSTAMAPITQRALAGIWQTQTPRADAGRVFSVRRLSRSSPGR